MHSSTLRKSLKSPGFRMLVGNVNYNNREQARNFRQLTYICMQNEGTREPEVIQYLQLHYIHLL